MRCSTIVSLVFALVFLAAAQSAKAVDCYWLGGDGDWHDSGEWQYGVVPDDNDAASIGSLGPSGTVTLYRDEVPDLVFNENLAIDGLTVRNGCVLDNNGYRLYVSDYGSSVTTIGPSSLVEIDQLRSNRDDRGFDVDFLTINGGQLSLNEGIAHVDRKATLEGGGSIGGYGTIRFGRELGGDPSGTVGLEIDDGSIIVSHSTPDATLRLETYDDRYVFDFGMGTIDADDGSGVNSGDQTVVIDGQLAGVFGAFQGTIDIGKGDTVDFTHGFNTIGATVNFNGDTGVATLTGGSVAVDVVSSGSTFNFISGTGRIENELTAIDGVFDVDAIAEFAGNAQFFTNSTVNLGDNATVQFDGTASFSKASSFRNYSRGTTIIVNNTVDIGSGDTLFNWDGADLENSQTIVNHSGELNLDVSYLNVDGLSLNDVFSGTLAMDSGDVNVEVGDGKWRMGGRLNMDNSHSNEPTLSGDTIDLTGDVVVGELDTSSGTSRISASVNMFSSATITVHEDNRLRFTGPSLSISNAAVFEGQGTIQPDSTTTTMGNVTVNMPDGVFDLDGASSGFDRLVLEGVVELNVNRVDTTNNIFHNDTIEIGEEGQLDVRLPGDDSWVMSGMLELVGNTDADPAPYSQHLDGSDVELRDTVDVSGRSAWNARVDITGDITVAADSRVKLKGGDLVNTNRIAGGTVMGDGRLEAHTASGSQGWSLVGYGTIDTDVNFAADEATLMADNGTLTLNGTLVDVGVLGTASERGILDVNSYWNTNVSRNGVQLNGGQLVGDIMVNDGRIRGHGLVAQRTGQDWDGTSGDGEIWAESGILELQAVPAGVYPFNGIVKVTEASEIYTNGFALQFSGSGLLEMTNGTYRSTNATNLYGTLHVNTGGVSTITAPNFVFQPGSTTVLEEDLELDNAAAQVNPPAFPLLPNFEGTGRLVNLATSQLDLLNGADTGEVEIVNEGQLDINGGGLGQVWAGGLEQSGTGEFHVDLVNNTLGNFDRMVTPSLSPLATGSGVANLDGGLVVATLAGFAATPGDEFPIIEATSLADSSFAWEDFSAAAGSWGIKYIRGTSPEEVRLIYLAAFAADFDGDGDVDGGDFLAWQTAFLVDDGGDANGDGVTDGRDFLIWQNEFRPDNGLANSAVPEPSAFAWVVVLAAVGVCLRNRS